MVVSNISARNSVENVRFASSAIDKLAAVYLGTFFRDTYSFGSGVLHGEYASFASKVSQVSHHHGVGCSSQADLALHDLV